MTYSPAPQRRGRPPLPETAKKPRKGRARGAVAELDEILNNFDDEGEFLQDPSDAPRTPSGKIEVSAGRGPRPRRLGLHVSIRADLVEKLDGMCGSYTRSEIVEQLIASAPLLDTAARHPVKKG